MSQILARFIIGGMIVSAFAIIGDVLKPKSFAGLFGAAPSVALATLAITAVSDGCVLCCYRGPFDDGRRDCIFYLCVVREPDDDAIQDPGHIGHIVLNSALARRSRERLLLHLG